MIDRNHRFEGKTVLVTGAAGGLGRAYAQGFAAEGARLVVLDIDNAGLQKTVESIREAGGSVERFTLDMADEGAIKSFAASMVEQHAAIDVLINNAGIAYGEISENFETLTQYKWLHFLSVNTVGPLLLAQALRPLLAACRGVILNQSSMASFAPGQAYGVTKAALNAMTYGMAHAFAKDGIRVNAIAPGLMETPAARIGLSAETYRYVQSLQLLKTHGEAADIVSLALFLASDDARFINCDVITCDAGNAIRGWRN